MDTNLLNQQSQHWETNFSNKPEMFGLEASVAAIKSLKIFKKNNINKIVELGAGLGRDTIYFAQNSIKCEALDYSPSAIKNIILKSKQKKISDFVNAKIFDIRQKLPFEDSTIEACYSHMLYCMALSNNDIQNLNKEIKRVLKPGGVNVFTVRNTFDGDYKNGIHRGEDLYENNGFIVHYFSKSKINSLLEGFDNLVTENFDEGSFPRKLFFVCNKKI